MSKPAYITGLGTITNYGDDKEDLKKAMYENHEDCSYGRIHDFDITRYLEKKGLSYLNRSTHLLLASTSIAIKDAELSINEKNAEKIGVSIGNVFGSLSSIQEFDYTTVVEGPKGVKPMQFSNCVKNSEAANISIKYGPKAFNTTLASGSASSLDAIAYALDMLTAGYADIVITGGVEEDCRQLNYGCQHLGILTKKPGGIADTYGNTNEDGIALSEGSGILVLENEESVKKRGAKIYGKIAGYSRRFCYSGDFGPDMEICMKAALSDVNITANDVDVVLGSFCGISTLDAAERNSIQHIFKNRKDICVYAPKMVLGETYSAAGALAAAMSAVMFNSEFQIPPKSKTIYHEELTDSVSHREKNINCIMVNAFDFAGQLITIILER